MGRRHFILVVLIILSSPINLFPQHNDPLFQTPKFENISIQDGLPENSVTCILQDYLGYLWLGTQNGLVRYDGYSMKIFQPEEGDSNSICGRRISVIFEDPEKTLWIGTTNGLNKLNRSNDSFRYYQCNPSDPKSINSNEVYSLYEDKVGRFWVGTAEGLNLFNHNTEIFTRYYFRYGDVNVYDTSLSYYKNLCVNAILEDPLTENLFIGTAKDGLWEFNLHNKTFSKYQFMNDTNPDKKIGWIQSLYKSENGKIWMASFHTLSILDPQKKEFSSFLEFPIRGEERFAKRDVPCAGIVEDRNGLIWSGYQSGAKGVFCVDPKTRYVNNYKIDPDTSKNSYGNHVYSLYIDRSDILWVGSWGLGLWKWDKRKIKFHTPVDEHYNFTNVNNTTANSLAYDSNGFIWLISHQGLEKYDLKNGKFSYYLQNEKSITQENVYTIFIDKPGNIWIGTYSEGLIKFNPSNGSYHFLFNNPNEPVNLINKIVVGMHQDYLGYIWIGTDGYGFYKYDIKKNKLTQFKHNPYDSLSITNNNARSIYEDRSGTLWFGTNFGGLNKFDRKTETFQYYGFKCVLSIYEDKTGNFWVADYYTGLNLFDRNTHKIIESYGRKEGLLSNSIWGILEDNNNNLWLKTDNGLFKFNTVTRIVKRYTKEDGLSDNFFQPYLHSHCMGPRGTMIFINSKSNSKDGVVVFNPDNIKDDPIPPKTIISKISLFNKPDEKLNINGFISELKEITLPYNQNDLRFDYVGLQYSEPLKNDYKYYLEHFDNDWVEAGTQRNATYTNLAPGEYTFKVTAANRDGVWNNKGASLKIIITPPWWKTKPAYFFFALFSFGLIYLIWKMQLKRIRIKHEYEMTRFEAAKLHEVDELKSRFFTNISHEFRTPLTLILGPVKQIIEKMNSGKVKDDLTVVDRNANKLLTLVNQLLDISKLESGNMKLQASAQNIVPFLKALVHSFASYAERKRITLKFCSPEDEIIAYIDNEKIEKIITNIISNAFKFTPEGGRIEVTVTNNISILNRYSYSELALPSGRLVAESGIENKKLKRVKLDNRGFVDISIKDTGIGIAEEKLPKIFDRFYQVDSSHKREKEGTGIGLALSKELIELHKGTINVESEEGKGTFFTISIPLGKEHLKPEEISDKETENEEVYENGVNIVIPEPDEYENKTDKQNFDFILSNKEPLPLLLIVEDNSDVRNYIKDNLKNNYSILEATDGEDGWNKAVNQIPDLIISDIMMPKMDGFELCRKLKTDEVTSHIPVIILTAKATDKDEIEGFETGADEYIMKPFLPEILKARIKNLIEQRKRIQEHFRKQGIIDLEKTKVTSADKKFLQKVFKIITESISDSSFNVHSLAEKSFIGYQVLHKKIVSLTGEQPVEVIRRIRLKRAAELIENNFGNISEIAIEVGFNNPAYFSECFKKQFGLSPSQYSH